MTGLHDTDCNVQCSCPAGHSPWKPKTNRPGGMPARSGQEGSCRAVTGHPPVSCNTSAGKRAQTRCDGIAKELVTVTTKWFRAYELPSQGHLHEAAFLIQCSQPASSQTFAIVPRSCLIAPPASLSFTKVTDCPLNSITNLPGSASAIQSSLNPVRSWM